MKKTIAMILLATAALSASSGAEHGGTDIVPRTVNFLIFAGILWYLLATPVKNYFSGRSAEIASRLNSVQDKLRESKALKEAAEASVEEAKAFAKELQSTIEKEKEILRKQIEEQCAAEKAVLEKQMQDKQVLAERQMVRGVVEKVMAEVARESAASLDKEKMAEIIMKKVA
jgi:F-type H+-transporting ATPase subunit b